MLSVEGWYFRIYFRRREISANSKINWPYTVCADAAWILYIMYIHKDHVMNLVGWVSNRKVQHSMFKNFWKCSLHYWLFTIYKLATFVPRGWSSLLFNASKGSNIWSLRWKLSNANELFYWWATNNRGKLKSDTWTQCCFKHAPPLSAW